MSDMDNPCPDWHLEVSEAKQMLHCVGVLLCDPSRVKAVCEVSPLEL